MATTEYRDIEGFPGYRVGDDGSVWSCRPPNGRGGLKDAWRQLKPGSDEAGRPVVSIYRKGGMRNATVHRLVAIAFLGPPPEGMQCCHNNRDRTDNRLVNLRWDTKKNNEADKIIHGTAQRGERGPNAKLTAEVIPDVRRRRASGEKLKLIADDLGVSVSTISRIALGRTWWNQTEDQSGKF